MYFLGIDGGGTKTDFLLLDENGKTIAQRKIGTISYKHVGMDYVTELLRENINQILDGNDAYICLAFPNWGESRVNDERFLCRIDKITDRPMKIVNDSAAGWAGSLGLEEGINLVDKISLAQKLVRADGMMVFLMKALVIGWERKRWSCFQKRVTEG